MSITDDAPPEAVLEALIRCADCWVPEARIIGDIRAADISRAVRAILSAPPRIPDLVWVDYDRGSEVQNPSFGYRVGHTGIKDEGEWVAIHGERQIGDVYPSRFAAKCAVEEHYQRGMTAMIVSGQTGN